MLERCREPMPAVLTAAAWDVWVKNEFLTGGADG